MSLVGLLAARLEIRPAKRSGLQITITFLGTRCLDMEAAEEPVSISYVGFQDKEVDRHEYNPQRCICSSGFPERQD